MASKLERFEALCASLRRNDPETTTLYEFNLPDACCRRLGDAVEGNTHVSSIDLRLCNALAADEGVDSAARLLRYIRESASVRKVELRCDRDPPRPDIVAQLLRLALLAVAESSHIEELIVFDHGTVVAPPDVIALILRTNKSLKTLSIELDDVDDLDHFNGGAASRKLVAEAFGANRTLECLILKGTHTVQDVLRNLGSHPCLRVLKLGCGTMAHIHALNHLLGITTSLEQLELYCYHFDKERMECFVEGLLSSRSLVNLKAQWCRFDSEATALFHSFMQMGETRSYIRELCFVNSSFADSTTGIVAAAFLTVPKTQHMGSSIASALRVLEFDDDIAAFYDTLAANAFRIRLPSVHHLDVSDTAIAGKLSSGAFQG